MSQPHSEGGTQTHQVAHGSAGKSSKRRLVLITIIMLGFAVLTWGVALTSRGTTGIGGTGSNITLIFIPAWLTLTIVVVIISFWFAKFLLTAERYRDSETPAPTPSSHPH